MTTELRSTSEMKTHEVWNRRHEAIFFYKWPKRKLETQEVKIGRPGVKSAYLIKEKKSQ